MLGVGAPLDLAEKDCLPLRVGQALERCMDVRRRRALVLVGVELELQIELYLLRWFGTKPGAAADDVAGDGLRRTRRAASPACRRAAWPERRSKRRPG